MEKNTIILIVSLLLVGLFLGEINEVIGYDILPFFRARLSRARAISSNQCTDSDGLNLEVKSTITGVKDGSSFSYTDSCHSNNVLKEYFCDIGNVPESKTYPCPEDYNCNNGACV